MRMIASKAYPRRLTSLWIRAGTDANRLLSHHSAYLNCMHHSSLEGEAKSSLTIAVFSDILHVHCRHYDVV